MFDLWRCWKVSAHDSLEGLQALRCLACRPCTVWLAGPALSGLQALRCLACQTLVTCSTGSCLQTCMQGVEEIMRAVRSSCKVVAIRMPPSPPPATPGIGEPQMADEPAGDEGVPTVATAAPTVAELQQQAVRAPGVQHAVESWQVMAFGELG